MTAYLLSVMMEPFVMMDRVTASDGAGGFVYTWTEGAEFDAVLRKDEAPQQIVAQQQGVNEMFTVIVDRAVTLDFHDVIKRRSDGAVFRLTSSTRDAAAPMPSTVPIAKATAERWELT